MVLGVAGVILAAGQAWCVASILGAALARQAPAAGWAVAGFVVASLLRAAVLLVADRRAVAAGAMARQRLRVLRWSILGAR